MTGTDVLCHAAQGMHAVHATQGDRTMTTAHEPRRSSAPGATA